MNSSDQFDSLSQDSSHIPHDTDWNSTINQPTESTHDLVNNLGNSESNGLETHQSHDTILDQMQVSDPGICNPQGDTHQFDVYSNDAISGMQDVHNIMQGIDIGHHGFNGEIHLSTDDFNSFSQPRSGASAEDYANAASNESWAQHKEGLAESWAQAGYLDHAAQIQKDADYYHDKAAENLNS